MRGLKLAYNRYLDDQVLAIAEEAGGTRPLKVAPVAKASNDLTQLFEVGDIIYADQPQFMQAIRGTLDAAAEVAQGARATPIRSQSATAFNQETATATTRLIYLIVGPLSRAGSRVRAIVGGAIEKADADTKATAIRNRILQEPDYFLELADRYNKNPRDPLLEDQMINYLSTAILKTDVEDDDIDEGSLLNSMQNSLQSASEAVINTVK